MQNVSLVLINHHFSTSSIRPFVVNMIEIGGIHVDEPKALPDDIQEFLDSANDGAILFSMGSIIKSKDFPKEKREAFVKAFSKLKQKVLWKYENETLPEKSENIMIRSWIPQRDILAHPNVKLFITHGGLLGTTEALVESVPVLGIPIYADQKMNMIRAEENGYGIVMDFNEITEKLITKNLNIIFDNQQFNESAKAISKLYNDRPMTPQQSIIYWVEYVIRHRGASHMKSPAHRLNYFQLQSIDVYLFVTLISVAVFIGVGTIVRNLIKRLENMCSDKKTKMS
jgi:UDP:flavonoid glycosyltransferase YjiC (YdhE family)